MLQPLERTPDPGFTPDYAFTRCPTRYHRDLILTFVERRARGQCLSCPVCSDKVRFFERFFLPSNCFQLIEVSIWSLPKFININYDEGALSIACAILRKESTKVSTLFLPTISRLNPSRKRLNDLVSCWVLRSTGGHARLLSKTSVIVVINVYDHSRGAVQLSRIRTPWSGLPV